MGRGTCDGKNMPELEAKLGREFRDHPETTAVLAANDITAAQCITCLERMGISVPGDVSVVGFDDTDPMFNGSNVNLLTTVRLPLAEIGKEAAKLLLNIIRGLDDQPQRSRCRWN